MMSNFLKTMIMFWILGFLISIFSECYAAAILCFVFLLKTLSDLFNEKEYQEVIKSLEQTKKYINECSNILRRDNE